jgi:ATP-dependent exoDNAse (exonuclease V) beta subunit
MHLLENEEGVFRDAVLKALPGWVEELQETGIEPGQIAILVRSSRQGASIASSLLEYARQSGKDGKFRLISNDSLLLVQNTSVSFLVSLLRYTLQPGHVVNNALLKHLYSLLQDSPADDSGSRFMHDLSPEELFPAAFVEQTDALRLLPLYELSENLIQIFKLGERPEDMPYLQAFQELIMDLQRKEAMGVADFLEYWEQNGDQKSVAVSQASNAIRIMTIHKSKGLEFKAVIVPFCDWSLTPDSRHTNILWCPTGGTGLERIPVVPVKYKKELIHSLFAPDYYRERMKSYMDNLNLLYVACTRAREHLILGIPGSKGKGLHKVNDLLEAVLDLSPGKEPCTPPLKNFLKDKHLDYGENRPRVLQEEPTDPWEFSDYPVNLRSRSLRIRMRNDQYYLDEAGWFRTERSFGSMMHELFSGMKGLEDLPLLLDRYVQDGLLPWSERAPLEELIRTKIELANVSKGFSGGIRVINERAILCGGSRVLRPDRVMIAEGKATVVDFKFGEQHKEAYHRQVRAYMEQLQELGHRQVEGYLWYVMQDQIIQVEL